MLTPWNISLNNFKSSLLVEMAKKKVVSMK
jgi:hypothetical protein